MKIDWRAYYREFCEIHGGEPVLYGHNKETGKGGWLLFSDGWRYPRTVTGPETPPRSDKEQLELIRSYWTIKRDTLKTEVKELSDRIRSYVSAQQKCSAPVMVKQRIVKEDNEGNRRHKFQAEAIDFEGMLTTLQYLANDLKHADEMLKDVRVPERYVEPHIFNPAAILTQIEEIEKDVK